MIVVPEVTLARMQDAIVRLYQNGFFDSLVCERPSQTTGHKRRKRRGHRKRRDGRRGQTYHYKSPSFPICPNESLLTVSVLAYHQPGASRRCDRRRSVTARAPEDDPGGARTAVTRPASITQLDLATVMEIETPQGVAPGAFRDQGFSNGPGSVIEPRLPAQDWVPAIARVARRHRGERHRLARRHTTLGRREYRRGQW